MRGDIETRRIYGSTAPPEKQRRAFADGHVPVAVYGLGKMGLPLAAVYAEVTGNVVGVDIDEDVVDRVAAGGCPVDNEPGLADAVERAVTEDRLRASAEPAAAAAAAQVHVVIVPTVVDADGRPDLSALEAAVRDIGRGLAPGDLVIVESTVPPGTCDELVAPLLAAESGLAPGEFGVAFCPERTSSGRALQDIRGAYPKVVGGIDTESTRAAALIYDEITNNEVLPVSDATTAECVKVFEGVYRDVNIALANELGRLTDELGVDVREAIATANTQPYCEIHDPGPGVGGHCIPYYPQFLIQGFTTDTPLLRTARSINNEMPQFTVRKLLELLGARDVAGAEASILLLGVTYRPGVAETRESPALAIADQLSEHGADVYAADPVLDDMSEVAATPVPIEEITDLDLDGIVVVTPHEAFETIPWNELDPLVVVDGRDAFDLAETHHDVYTIGRG